MRQRPEGRVISWLDQQPRTSVWITSVTVLEIRFGLQIMQSGRKKAQLLGAFETLLQQKIENRIQGFDADSARQAADLMALRQRPGHPVAWRDTMIAGIALASKATLATRNVKHFADLSIPLVNPWEA